MNAVSKEKCFTDFWYGGLCTLCTVLYSIQSSSCYVHKVHVYRKQGSYIITVPTYFCFGYAFEYIRRVMSLYEILYSALHISITTFPVGRYLLLLCMRRAVERQLSEGYRSHRIARAISGDSLRTFKTTRFPHHRDRYNSVYI